VTLASLQKWDSAILDVIISKYKQFPGTENYQQQVVPEHCSTPYPAIALILSSPSNASLACNIPDGYSRAELITDLSLKNASTNVSWKSICIINFDANAALTKNDKFDAGFASDVLNASNARVLIAMSGARTLAYLGILDSQEDAIYEACKIWLLRKEEKLYIVIVSYEPGASRYRDCWESRQMTYLPCKAGIDIMAILDGMCSPEEWM